MFDSSRITPVPKVTISVNDLHLFKNKELLATFNQLYTVTCNLYSIIQSLPSIPYFYTFQNIKILLNFYIILNNNISLYFLQNEQYQQYVIQNFPNNILKFLLDFSLENEEINKNCILSDNMSMRIFEQTRPAFNLLNSCMVFDRISCLASLLGCSHPAMPYSYYNPQIMRQNQELLLNRKKMNKEIDIYKSTNILEPIDPSYRKRYHHKCKEHVNPIQSYVQIYNSSIPTKMKETLPEPPPVSSLPLKKEEVHPLETPERRSLPSNDPANIVRNYMNNSMHPLFSSSGKEATPLKEQNIPIDQPEESSIPIPVTTRQTPSDDSNEPPPPPPSGLSSSVSLQSSLPPPLSILNSSKLISRCCLFVSLSITIHSSIPTRTLHHSTGYLPLLPPNSIGYQNMNYYPPYPSLSTTYSSFPMTPVLSSPPNGLLPSMMVPNPMNPLYVPSSASSTPRSDSSGSTSPLQPSQSSPDRHNSLIEWNSASQKNAFDLLDEELAKESTMEIDSTLLDWGDLTVYSTLNEMNKQYLSEQFFDVCFLF